MCCMSGNNIPTLSIVERVCARVALILVLLGIGLLPGTPAHAQNPQPGITSPAPGSSISGDVPIFGTAVIEPFQKYELAYKLEPSGDDAYIFFDSSTTPVIDGQLGVWSASGLAPGVYSLRLRVVKNDGNYAEYYAPNLSVNLSPTPTPTPDEPTPTPIPTATFTPAPQPTPDVGQVEQPLLEPQATPTDPAAAVGQDETGDGAGGDPLEPAEIASVSEVAAAPDQASAGASVTRELGEAVSLARLRTEFLNGVRISAALLLAVTALYGGKRLFSWAWTQFS